MTMTLTSKRKNKSEYYGYASVRGQSHAATNTPNQDSVKVRRSQYGITLVVADGVGSHRFSQIGSRAIVKSVTDAFFMFESGKIPVTDITATAFKLFKKRVPVNKNTQSSTTCIFAHISEKHGLFVGQVGDGACYIEINDNFTALKGKESEFANIVVPLNPSLDTAKWHTRHFKADSETKLKILLATDGVSNDIIPEKENQCLEHYCTELGKIGMLGRNLFVRRTLKHWDVPGSSDDKTMIVYSRG